MLASTTHMSRFSFVAPLCWAVGGGIKEAESMGFDIKRASAEPLETLIDCTYLPLYMFQTLPVPALLPE